MIAMRTVILGTLLFADPGESLVPKGQRTMAEEASQLQSQKVATGTASLIIERSNSASPSVVLVREDTSGVAIDVIGEPEYQESTRQLTVSLAIRNKSRLRLIEPAGIGISQGDISLKNQLSPSSSELVVIGDADTKGVFQTDAAVRQVLSFSRLSRDVGDSWPGRAGLRPDSQSTVRKLSMVLPAEAARFEVRLMAVAALRLDVPALSPEGSPDSVIVRLEDSSLIAPHPRYRASRIRREYFWVRFARDVSQERRQEIVDQVDGVVVGGMRALGDQYLVQLAPGTSVNALQRAVATVAAQPGVLRADLYVEMRPLRPQYSEPNDGSPYAHRTSNSSSASGAIRSFDCRRGYLTVRHRQLVTPSLRNRSQ